MNSIIIIIIIIIIYISTLVDGRMCLIYTDMEHTAYMDAWKKDHKTARRILSEDEHLVVRNMSKTL
jgi:hypothetical protein